MGTRTKVRINRFPYAGPPAVMPKKRLDPTESRDVRSIGKFLGYESPWDEPLFGEYLRLLKARGMELPKLRKKPRLNG